MGEATQPFQYSNRCFCRACGGEIDPRASICPRCGVAQAGAPGQGHPNAGLALVLNIFLPGVGTLVIGKVGVGITQIVLGLIALPLWFFGIGFLLSIGVWIWAIVVAAQSFSTR